MAIRFGYCRSVPGRGPFPCSTFHVINVRIAASMQFTCVYACIFQVGTHAGQNSKLCLSTCACLSGTTSIIQNLMYMYMSMARFAHGSMQVPLTIHRDQGISVPGTTLQSWRMLIWQTIKIP